MISKATAPHGTWTAGDSWTLADQPRLHVMQERMRPHSAERRHLHQAVQQLYYVLAGVATVRFDDRAETLMPGDAAHIPAATPHQLCNDSADELEFLVISSAPPRLDRIDLDRDDRA